MPETPNLKVVYSDQEVQNGSKMELVPLAKEPASVTFDDPEDDYKYCLILIDVDAPGPVNPKFRHWLHWMVANIPAADIKKGRVGGGKQLMDYAPPSPVKNSGVHRYVYGLFKQKNREGDMVSGDKPVNRTK